jgi:hypothetical protein
MRKDKWNSLQANKIIIKVKTFYFYFLNIFFIDSNGARKKGKCAIDITG